MTNLNEATKQDDVLIGGAGHDTINGQGGDDIIDGGSHSDMLQGSRGRDIVLGGSDDDSLKGAAESDHLSVGSGEVAANLAQHPAVVAEHAEGNDFRIAIQNTSRGRAVFYAVRDPYRFRRGRRSSAGDRGRVCDLPFLRLGVLPVVHSGRHGSRCLVDRRHGLRPERPRGRRRMLTDGQQPPK